MSISTGWSLKEVAGRPMILIHQVAYPSAWRDLRSARQPWERIRLANETQRAGRTIQMLRGAIREVKLGVFLICKVIKIDLVSQIGA